MPQSKTAHFSFNDKTLTLFCAAICDPEISPKVPDYAKQAFKNLSPYIKNSHQVLYIRDIPQLAIKGKYPGGHCYNPHEAMISLTSWQDDERQINAAINHELHHMARWQNAGYGNTLGGAIVSEGVATYYEHVQSGWLSPWASAKVSDDALKAALHSWDDARYNHSEWFFNGPHGEWVGYGIGYKLAAMLFRDGFDVGESLKIEASRAVTYLM